MTQSTGLEEQLGSGPVPGKPAPSPSNPAPGKTSPDPELARDKYGVLLVVVAFVLLGTVFVIAIFHFKTASDVAAVVGSVGTVIGTIVGAFFGVHAGASGRQTAEAGRQAAEAGRQAAEAGRAKAESDRAKSDRLAQAALAKLDPATAESLIKDI